MSLSYRVSLQVCEVVSAHDKTVHQLDLRDILPEAQMKDLLREALIERGFEPGERAHELVRVGEHSEAITVDLETLELTTQLEGEREVSGKVDAWGDAESRRAAKRQAVASANVKANALLERGREDAQREVTRQLAQGEPERLEQMHQVLQDVYAEALKRKARSLGDVVDQYEGTNERGEYELVIKVEV